MATDAAMPRQGRPVSRWAVAAGVVISPRSSSAPTTWTSCATITPAAARNTTLRTRTGTPRASATRGSIEANRSGRPMNSMTATTAAAIQAVWPAVAASIPKIDPNRTRTAPAPLPVALAEVKTDRKRTPRPRSQVKTTPVTTSSSPAAEDGEEDGHRHGGTEHAGAGAEAEGEGGEATGEGDVAESVAGEDLVAQHEEGADKAGGDAGGRPGGEGLAEEVLRQWPRPAGHQQRRHATADRPPRRPCRARAADAPRART